MAKDGDESKSEPPEMRALRWHLRQEYELDRKRWLDGLAPLVILPTPPTPPPTDVAADAALANTKDSRKSVKDWIVDEAERMKNAGEVPDTQAGFARALEKRMQKDPLITRPVGWRYITNQLKTWGLWPV